ncbi:hypothetical protein KBB17_02710 [Candidatus Saccharibacteria bacterium]|nr:hypothetical protein [Candidatus Saccharibacteria bacterium]
MSQLITTREHTEPFSFEASEVMSLNEDQLSVFTASYYGLYGLLDINAEANPEVDILQLSIVIEQSLTQLRSINELHPGRIGDQGVSALERIAAVMDGSLIPEDDEWLSFLHDFDDYATALTDLGVVIDGAVQDERPQRDIVHEFSQPI